jgi:hypothetical protein
MARQKGDKIFYGWWVVLAAGVGLALHYGPIITATFGVFFKPLSQEFGWSRAEVSLAFSLSTLVGGGALLVLGGFVLTPLIAVWFMTQLGPYGTWAITSRAA